MNFSVVFCHFKTGKMSAYTISQLLKYKGKHNLEILICNNNAGDGSEVYLEPFKDVVKIVDYPKDLMQSHGIGYNMLFEMATNEWVICLESDAFPIIEGWLNYYVWIINEGYDCAGSLLTLSGGSYIHPAGCLYRRSIFVEAFKYYSAMEYYYFPNMSMKEGFACHTMVHKNIVNDVLANPEDYIELADGYKPFYPKLAEEKAIHYGPVCGPFHTGVGSNQESIKTYGQRTIESEVPNILLDYKQKLINRIGYEPGQAFCYWQLAMNKKIFYIPTATEWLSGKENQQQKFTVTENGVKHCWGISAYYDYEGNDQEIIKFKQALPDALYNTLPIHQKIH